MKNVVLLQDHMNSNAGWILFSNPKHIIVAENAGNVQECLTTIEDYINNGYYAAGYVAYEASAGMDASLRTRSDCGYPVLWFGIYEQHQEYNLSLIEDDDFTLGTWRPNISRDQYIKDIDAVKNYIRNGDTYQVNYTFRLRSILSGNPLSLFKTLARAQSSKYCAFVNTGDTVICSASPELFFKFSEGTIVSRPMKGTVKRGVSIDLDNKRAAWLQKSIKNRAENVMIVDMIRNDMGRIAHTGSIHVDKLFSIERYPTVFQMTSTVSAKTDISPVQIMRHMFPCASITGAPKVRTMEIINELEAAPRGIYTGSIGYFSPDKKAQFNVAIRTVVVDSATGNTEYGVGGGIVWDSAAEDEFNECKLKAKVLTYREPPFELLETMVWSPDGGFLFLDNHMSRMRSSAQYFNYTFNETYIRDLLHRAVSDATSRTRVRITVNRAGKASVSVHQLGSLAGKSVGISMETIDSQSRYIYHKTTNRRIYDQVKSQCSFFDDVILINKDNLVTESCIANIVIRRNDELLTPSHDCGLLDGVFRSILLSKGTVKEATISREELYSADAIYLVNSVRGWMKLESVEGQGYWKIGTVSLFDSSIKEASEYYSEAGALSE